jgi:hypothetical protein
LRSIWVAVSVGAGAFALGVGVLPDKTGPGSRTSEEGQGAGVVKPSARTYARGLMAQRYAPLQTPTGLRIKFVGSILFVGHYEGTFEPCGCASGQAGGHAFELPLIRAMRDVLGDGAVVVGLGEDIGVTGSVPAGGGDGALRVAGARYLTWYLGAAGIEHWMASAADLAFVQLGRDPAMSETVVSSVPRVPGLEGFAQRFRGVDVSIRAVEAEHLGPEVVPAAEAGHLQVVVLHGSRGAGVKAREWATEFLHASGGSAPLRLLIDVEAGVLPAGGPLPSVIGVGSPQGTYLYVLRLATLDDVSEPPTRLVSLHSIGPALLLESRAGASRLPETLSGALLYDWWPVRVAHVESDDGVGAALRGLRGAREESIRRTLASVRVDLDVECARCHREQVEACALDAHDHAKETLVRVARHEDPNCMVCHDTAFLRGVSAHGKGGVTCASCHGPVVVKDGGHERGQIPTEETCRGCHSLHASPGFRAQEALGRIGCARVGPDRRGR